MIFDHWIKARVTAEQKALYLKLGGSVWLKEKIDKAAARQTAEQECGALEQIVRANAKE